MHLDVISIGCVAVVVIVLAYFGYLLHLGIIIR